MEVIKSTHRANVLIVGAGAGGTALLEILNQDPTTHVVGVVDINPDAQGIQLARKLGIKVAQHAHFFFEDSRIHVDVLIEVTGSDAVRKELQNIKPPETRMIGGKAAKFIWALIEAQKGKHLYKRKYHALKATLEDKAGEDLIFGTNPIMKQIRQMIQQVAPTPATVLITGETGTGKEVIATAIQQMSHLKDEPFIKINCTAFPTHLLESELFGYKKGAFTGASKDKEGLLQQGDGGTIFLDEIGDISMDMQVKMLRFLQFGEIRPLGSNITHKVNCRIIAATNRELQKLIEQETFRKDLYYRLNSFVLELPPLRERKEDIPILAYHFLKLAVNKLNKKVSTISSAAMEYLHEYDYPGNLRELQSMMERAVILCQTDTIEPAHLPLSVQSMQVIHHYTKGLMEAKQEVIGQFEKNALQHYLMTADGNISQAAMYAKIPRRTFYRLLKKHQIDPAWYKALRR